MVSAVGAEPGVVGHVLGGAVDQFGPSVERFARRTGAVIQFGEKDRVRLFPEENLVPRPRRSPPFRTETFLPLKSAHTELFGQPARRFFELPVDG